MKRALSYNSPSESAIPESLIQNLRMKELLFYKSVFEVTPGIQSHPIFIVYSVQYSILLQKMSSSIIVSLFNSFITDLKMYGILTRLVQFINMCFSLLLLASTIFFSIFVFIFFSLFFNPKNIIYLVQHVQLYKKKSEEENVSRFYNQFTRVSWLQCNGCIVGVLNRRVPEFTSHFSLYILEEEKCRNSKLKII